MGFFCLACLGFVCWVFFKLLQLDSFFGPSTYKEDKGKIENWNCSSAALFYNVICFTSPVTLKTSVLTLA